MRLLSFISEIEKVLVANSPTADGPGWATLRVVNFGCRLARLSLVARASGGIPAAGAALVVQALQLADGTRCLKATIDWPEGARSRSFLLYGHPEIDWPGEAARLAAVMLDGPAPAASVRAA